MDLASKIQEVEISDDNFRSQEGMPNIVQSDLEQSMSQSMLDFVQTYGIAVQKKPDTIESRVGVGLLDKTQSTAMLTNTHKNLLNIGLHRGGGLST